MPIVYSTLNHPLRVALAAEIHSRPPVKLEAPERITHLAIYGSNDIHAAGDNLAMQHKLLAALCLHFGVTAPAGVAKYFFHDFGRFRLKWECHTEFASYTFVAGHALAAPSEVLFTQMPLADLPEEWLLSLRGMVIVATHVVLEPAGESSEQAVPHMRRLFEGNAIVGCEASHDAQVWTDFLIHADGFGRFVVRDDGLYGMQAGRLIQRLLEIETYRMMALLGLPHAQRANPALNAIEAELATLTATMVEMDVPQQKEQARNTRDSANEQLLLEQITALAARLERMAVDNSYRFSASQAYFGLVHARIEELRERRIEGVPTIAEFMDRRLTPAMNTCSAVAHRQQILAERIANTNALLRTRVGIVQEQQNSKILESMNTRAAQQLRLQQAVEGLSVVAISYYLTGLLSYAGKGFKAAGLHFDSDLTTGIAVPVVVLIVWLGLRRMHKHVKRKS
ncbi:MAG: DUF3422 domain-containing protein [Burkholderiaceae bacterium]